MKQYHETVRKDNQDLSDGIKYQDQEIYNLVNRIKKSTKAFLSGESPVP
jgi:hypothetical protein